MILITFIIICFIHLSFWIAFLLFLNQSSKYLTDSIDPLPPVSIVVCFKNEAENLKSLLAFLISQDYPLYEIVLVNDHSDDTSTRIIAAFDDPRIRMLELPDIAQGKKMAQDLGIKSATYNTILVTDADCTGSSSWIKSMVAGLNDKDLCLGYGPLEYQGSFASQFAIYESWMAAVQYFSYALAGIPYMGVGRNMAFKKDLFLKAGGHASHLDLASGDDDLFVNAAANGSNTTIQLTPESYTWSPSKNSWSAFINQKARHLTTSTRYRLTHQALLSLFALSQMALYIIPLVSIIIHNCVMLWIAFAIALSVKYLMARSINKKLPCRNLPVLFPLMDMILALYYLFMPIIMIFKKDASWK